MRPTANEPEEPVHGLEAEPPELTGSIDPGVDQRFPSEEDEPGGERAAQGALMAASIALLALIMLVGALLLGT